MEKEIGAGKMSRSSVVAGVGEQEKRRVDTGKIKGAGRQAGGMLGIAEERGLMGHQLCLSASGILCVLKLRTESSQCPFCQTVAGLKWSGRTSGMLGLPQIPNTTAFPFHAHPYCTP